MEVTIVEDFEDKIDFESIEIKKSEFKYKVPRKDLDMVFVISLN